MTKNLLAAIDFNPILAPILEVLNAILWPAIGLVGSIDSAIGFYIIPEAESLWEVSKALLVSGDLIMQQNPDLQFPFNSPQRIVVYRQKRL